MMNKESKNKKLIYRQLLISYIMILVLPITLGCIVYYNALDIIEKDARDARVFMLKQSCIFMDNYFKDLEQVAVSISLDPSLQNIIYMNPPAYGSSDIYNVNMAQRALGSYSFSTSFDSSFYIFLRQPDIVFAYRSTQKTVQFGMNGYFDNNIQYGDLTYEKWYENILGQYYNKAILPAQDMHGVNTWSSSTNCIAYVQSIPLGYINDPKGAIEVLINTEGINKLLSDVDESKSGWTYILNEKGQVITGVTNGNEGFPTINIDIGQPAEYLHQKINGANMAIMSLKSGYNGWTYVTILPENTIMAKANYIKGIILVIVVLSLAMGLIVSFLLAKRNAKPINEVILTLRSFFQGEIEKGRNEYDFLKYGISRLINVNADMKTTVDNQAILLKSNFLGRLIKGEFTDESEIDMQRKHLDIELGEQWFSAAIVDLQVQNDLKNKEQLIEQDIYRLILSRTLNSHMEKAGYIYFLNTSQMVVIMSFDYTDKTECMERVKKLFEMIRNDLQSTYNVLVDFFIGSPYDRLIDVNLSYHEASSLLDHFGREDLSKHVIVFWEEKLDNTGYFYPLEIEHKLINMASTGNIGEITRMMNSIYKENFEIRMLTNNMQHQLLSDMKGTILKSFEKMKPDLCVKELFSSNQSSMQSKDIFAMIQKAYNKICETANNRKKSHNSNLIDKLMAYINSNYCSPDISVSQIASEFGISESYLSQFIKEQTGESFSDHVEMLRIRRACDLLKTQSISVDNISRLVGYNSAYTFRRAFKRVTGVLPTEYNVGE